MNRLAVAGLALGLDLLFGEPPARLHPVVWLGRLIDGAVRRAPTRGRPAAELAGGALLVGLCIGLSAALAALAHQVSRRLLVGDPNPTIPHPVPSSPFHPRPSTLALPPPSSSVVGRRSSVVGRRSCYLAAAVLLKTTFAVRALFASVQAVERPLAQGKVEPARRALARIVSREITTLDGDLIAASAIESLAENLSDSIVAPLTFYLAFGLPGAAAYRAINTLDAMIGYRGRFEYLGKVAAHLDDLANLLPARITALLIATASPLAGGRFGNTLRILRANARRTASPNAGWPMAAMAGALNLRLEKPGHYVLNPDGATPTAADVGRARRLATWTLGIGGGLLLLGLASHD